jgi:beta-xylosidase
LSFVRRDLITLSLAAAVTASAASAQTSYIATSSGPGRFSLAHAGSTAPLVASSADFSGVVRAANDLRSDLLHVTGAQPTLSIDTLPRAPEIVLVGTLGKAPLIDRLVREKKLDVTGVAGRWETNLIQTIERPFPGVDRALVITGSDKRGTIYGIYDVSSQIGVSPWTWWADVPIQHRADLFVLPGRHTDGEPAVKYRGIFLNDEAPALSGWAKEKFGGFNHAFYVRVFELILRLKGNYLWPAMWGSAFNDDDSQNPVLADEYGIVMGTSHHEPMLRAQQEWKRYGKGEWNYEHNDSTLRAFWADGIRHMGTHESIVTIGMRGDGDMPMTAGSNIDLLERIVRDQRAIIAQVTGKPAAATPQLWALYKEVQDYYDKGMRAPDDVTLLFSDDNWGNVRRLPARADTARPGGFGIYYHFDYVGGPRNYKWVNTNPIARVWEQMHLAYAYGARRIWIVNVGDLKPMEFPISFFLDYAWNPSRWPADKLPDYTRQWAAQQFGPEHAAAIADVMTRTLEYAARRKPELLDTATYSLTNFREAERVVAEYDTLRQDAQAIAGKLPPEYKDSYFELVLHPVLAAANLNELYVTAARNHLYAREGRAATNDLADSVRALFARDAEITSEYNTGLAGGKWNHMMDQTHIGYTYWQEPPHNTMPRVDVIQLPPTAEMGVAVVEQNRPAPARRPGAPPFAFGSGPREPTLPTFLPYSDERYHLDIYARGQQPFDFSVETGEPWVVVRPSRGHVVKEQRVTVTVDWAAVPPGVHRVPITITGPDQRRVTVQVPVDNSRRIANGFTGFSESDGYVSMQSEHYTRAVESAGVRWLRIPDFGRTSSGVTPMPVTAPSQSPGGDSPRLEYAMFLFDSGSVAVNAYVAPTLDFTGAASGLRYAVSFDDEPPQIVNVQADTSTRAWEKSVADNIIVGTTRHTIARGGAHVLKFWMVDPGVVVEKLVVEARPIGATYLGPPESPRHAMAGARAATADVVQAARAAKAAPPVARFDWFEYDGHDSVYKTLERAPSKYLNPILAGFYPDPSITRAGGDYYLVNSSFAYFPGVPIFHSRDLVHWTQIGHVLHRPSQLKLDSLGVSRGIFAPAIRYHAGTFYMITTLADGGGNFYVTARNPAGPWSDPIWLHELDGIDPSFFFDDDGRAYIVNNGPPVGTPLYNGHRAIWFQEIDLATNTMIGPRKVIVNGGVDLAKHPIWIEAPHIIKVGKTYYLICAEGGTADQHSEVVFRSDSVGGPYVPYAGNPILTQRHLDPSRPFPITSTGHADFVDTPAGEWWAVFLGARPYTDDLYNTGRETFLLPVHWRNGWPTMLTGTATVPYTEPAPRLPHASAPIPTSGNFIVRDDFGERSLPLYWEQIRTPHERWYDLGSMPGWLSIIARPDAISGRGQPSFLGRRQQHIDATASTAVRFDPTEAGDKAGLVAFQNETHYYFLSLGRTSDTTVVQLEMRNGAAPADSVLATAPIRVPRNGVVYLRIDARGATYDFSYALTSGAWTPLVRDADGTILSTHKAGGFVGTMFGLYAYAAPSRGAP